MTTALKMKIILFLIKSDYNGWDFYALSSQNTGKIATRLHQLHTFKQQNQEKPETQARTKNVHLVALKTRIFENTCRSTIWIGKTQKEQQT